MRVSNHETHAWESGDFLGRALRVAAGDHDACVGLRAVDATNGLAKLVVGSGGDGASIEDDQVGVGKFVGRVKSARSKPGFERGSVGLRSAASERLYEVTRQAPILTWLFLAPGIVIARNQARAAVEGHILVAP